MMDLEPLAKDDVASAIGHLQLAIGLLDKAGVPGHIAAHVDLAAQQLRTLHCASAWPEPWQKAG